MSDVKEPLIDSTATPTGPPPTYTRGPLPPGGPGKPPFPLQIPTINHLRSRRTILASASPRRRQLLAQIGLTNIEVCPSSFAEDIDKRAVTPFQYVLETASAKALDVYQKEINNPTKGDPEIIIAADTIVVGFGGQILEKPRSEREHIAMLKSLRDGGRRATTQAIDDDEIMAGLGAGVRGEKITRVTAPAAMTAEENDAGWHHVYTAVAVLAPLASARQPGYALDTAVEETRVKFDYKVSDDLIHAYVRTREGADKAGGYGIQGMGSLLIEKIDGTWDNVVGLPLRATLRLVEKVLALADEEGFVDEELVQDDDDDDDSDA